MDLNMDLLDYELDELEEGAIAKVDTVEGEKEPVEVKKKGKRRQKKK